MLVHRTILYVVSLHKIIPYVVNRQLHIIHTIQIIIHSTINNSLQTIIPYVVNKFTTYHSVVFFLVFSLNIFPAPLPVLFCPPIIGYTSDIILDRKKLFFHVKKTFFFVSENRFFHDQNKH